MHYFRISQLCSSVLLFGKDVIERTSGFTFLCCPQEQLQNYFVLPFRCFNFLCNMMFSSGLFVLKARSECYNSGTIFDQRTRLFFQFISFGKMCDSCQLSLSAWKQWSDLQGKMSLCSLKLDSIIYHR